MVVVAEGAVTRREDSVARITDTKMAAMEAVAEEAVVETGKEGVEVDLEEVEDQVMEVVVEAVAGEVQLVCVLQVQEEIMEEVPPMIGGATKKLNFVPWVRVFAAIPQ